VIANYRDTRLGSLRLVGMRNAIGHGASFTAPGSRELNELIDYTRSLITQYAELVIDQLNTYALPDPEPEPEQNQLISNLNPQLTLVEHSNG